MTSKTELPGTWAPYLGYGNILSQKDKDQGDTCQRIALFYTLSKILSRPRDYRSFELNFGFWGDVKSLTFRPGIYRRSPDPKHWGYDPDCLSRDNHGMLILAFAVLGFKKELIKTSWEIIKRFGFFQNIKPGTDHPKDFTKTPDFLTPGIISTTIRGLNLWPLYPLLLILDLSLSIEIYLAKKDNHDYFNMLAANIFYSVLKYPTPGSIISFWILKKTDFLDQINNYYSERDDRNGLEPLSTLYAEAFYCVDRSYWNL